MKRRQGESPTKEALLNAAERLMLAKGYTATSIDEICTMVGVTKGGFFHYFPTKQELAKAALHRFYAATGGRILGFPLPETMDPLQRVYQRLDILIEMARNPDLPKSCLIGNLTQEVSHTHPELRAVCDELFSRWVNGFEGELAAAKAKHVPQATWSPQSLAEHLLATIQGSLLLAKSSQDPAIVEKNLLHYRNYLEGLFEARKEARKHQQSVPGGPSVTQRRRRLSNREKEVSNDPASDAQSNRGL